MKEVKETKVVTEDGTEFETQSACEEYERRHMFKFKKGDGVFGIDSFGYIVEGVVEKCECVAEHNISDDDHIRIYKVKLSVGSANFWEKDVFKSYGDAISAKAKRSKIIREEYESKINNLPQLFTFMIMKMHCEEYTDYEAIEAVKNKIKEITGFDMNNDVDYENLNRGH